MRRPLSIVVDGVRTEVREGCTLAAALAMRAMGASRRSVRGEPRAAFCGMGICHECRVEVDGARVLACQKICREGMQVRTLAPTNATR
jgi:aerobic-type carbon monoxide dehydrogenase small subunit (CoxS/CutS family)